MIKTEEREAIKRNIILVIGRGRSASLPGVQLAALVGSDPPGKDRTFRFLVLELIDEGHPIASTNSKPAGYFMAETPDEVNAYAHSLRKRLIKDALRRRDFLRASRSILQPTQTSFQFEGAYRGAGDWMYFT